MGLNVFKSLRSTNAAAHNTITSKNTGIEKTSAAAFVAVDVLLVADVAMLPLRYKNDIMPDIPPPTTFWKVKREIKSFFGVFVRGLSKTESTLSFLVTAHHTNTGISPIKGSVLERSVSPIMKTRFLLFFSSKSTIVASHTGKHWLNTQKS